MISEKKIQFLEKQGFKRSVIENFMNYKIDKYILWFLSMNKKGLVISEQEAILLNNYFEKSSDPKATKREFLETLSKAKEFDKNEKRKIKNIIHKFDNGYYVSVLNASDLYEEGTVMSNCVGGYEQSVYSGEVGIIALKQPSGKTVAHIQISKNGLISQNFAKANTPIKKEYWMMIVDFFNKNSKSVDLSKMFGESYYVNCHGSLIKEISLSIPTAISVYVKNGKKEQQQIDGFEVKRFTSSNSYTTLSLNSKEELIDFLENKKKEILVEYDDMISQVLATSASSMYLSDEIKEKIFGNKKGSYYMKGDDYDLSEIDPRTYYPKEGAEEIEIDVPRAVQPINGFQILPPREDARVYDEGDRNDVQQGVERPVLNEVFVNIGRPLRRADVVMEAPRAVEMEQNMREEILAALDENLDEEKVENKLDYIEIPFTGDYGVDDNTVNSFEKNLMDADEAVEEVKMIENAEELGGDMAMENAPIPDVQEPLNEIVLPPEPFEEIMRRAKKNN